MQHTPAPYVLYAHQCFCAPGAIWLNFKLTPKLTFLQMLPLTFFWYVFSLRLLSIFFRLCYILTACARREICRGNALGKQCLNQMISFTGISGMYRPKPRVQGERVHEYQLHTLPSNDRRWDADDAQ